MVQRKRPQSGFFWWGLAFILLLVGYFTSRLVNITSLPIFTDEAIYIRWSQIGSRDPQWRFISLTDGKQPLFTWMMMIAFKAFPSLDPLFVGRLTSICAGALGLCAICFIGYELTRKKSVAFISGLLYVLSPFSLMYDRLALYDSLTAACFLWSTYFSILLVKYLRLDIALILGLILGAGMLNKSSGFLSLYFLPITLLLFDFSLKDRWKKLMLWIGLLLISSILSQIVYSILRLSPLFHMVEQKNQVFVYSFSEWLTHPMRFFEGNMKGLFDWLTHYMTKVLLVMIPISFAVSKHQIREKFILLMYWFFPFIALALFGRVLYPRFILFMVMPLYILIAMTLSWFVSMIADRANTFMQRILSVTLCIGVIFPSIYTSYKILTDVLHAPIPLSDQNQYIHDWPSGWGVKESIDTIRKEAQDKKVTVYTDGTFGLFPYAIEIYLVDHPNVEIQGIWPINPQKQPDDMIQDARDHLTYLILNQTLETPNWNLKLVHSYQKGLYSDRSLRLYHVLPATDITL